MGDAGPHAIEQVVASGIISAIKRMPEGYFVGRAMAFEYQSTQAEATQHRCTCDDPNAF